jgi:hypothetical protein
MNNFNFIEGVKLSELCDYSFGDQSGIICRIYNGYSKFANISNTEFIEKLEFLSKDRNYMTLFIDNIRLYKRDIIGKPSDQSYLNELLNSNNLLELCSKFEKMNFIIFTNLEDTPIDSKIEGKIPNNILSINAVNAIYNNDKIIPFPYGLQRSLYPGDSKYTTLESVMNDNLYPEKLVYINHNIKTNTIEREGINELFQNRNWATVDITPLDYNSFLTKIKKHKFMICPMGNAVDCHRNWEVLYLGRVPIMRRSEYLEYLFKDFPVLFVNNYSDVTEELLLENEHLYQDALNIDINKLNIIEIFNRIVNNNII